MNANAEQLLAILLGGLLGAAIFLLIMSIRGFEVSQKRRGPGPLERTIRDAFSIRGAIALGVGVLALLMTGWLVAGIGIGLLAFAWRGIGGAAGERRAMDRLEALATWTESLRDTIAGAVGLEQAIPSSLRVAGPVLQVPLSRLVDRLHTRMPLDAALRRFADDMDDPSADLIIAALIINSRLRGPGLRDLLGSLADSVREELDMRRKVNAERKSTRRSVQIVIGVSVGLAVLLGVFDHSFLSPYNGAVGQLVLALVGAIYAAGILWLRGLAKFDSPDRLLVSTPDEVSAPASVSVWQGGGAS
ncbi:MAG: type II secretion system F family protein [Streptosporangiaceae bacterium]